MESELASLAQAGRQMVRLMGASAGTSGGSNSDDADEGGAVGSSSGNPRSPVHPHGTDQQMLRNPTAVAAGPSSSAAVAAPSGKSIDGIELVTVATMPKQQGKMLATDEEDDDDEDTVRKPGFGVPGEAGLVVVAQPDTVRSEVIADGLPVTTAVAAPVSGKAGDTAHGFDGIDDDDDDEDESDDDVVDHKPPAGRGSHFQLTAMSGNSDHSIGDRASVSELERLTLSAVDAADGIMVDNHIMPRDRTSITGGTAAAAAVATVPGGFDRPYHSYDSIGRHSGMPPGLSSSMTRVHSFTAAPRVGSGAASARVSRRGDGNGDGRLNAGLPRLSSAAAFAPARPFSLHHGASSQYSHPPPHHHGHLPGTGVTGIAQPFVHGPGIRASRRSSREDSSLNVYGCGGAPAAASDGGVTGAGRCGSSSQRSLAGSPSSGILAGGAAAGGFAPPGLRLSRRRLPPGDGSASAMSVPSLSASGRGSSNLASGGTATAAANVAPPAVASLIQEDDDKDAGQQHLQHRRSSGTHSSSSDHDDHESRGTGSFYRGSVRVIATSNAGANSDGGAATGAGAGTDTGIANNRSLSTGSFIGLALGDNGFPSNTTGTRDNSSGSSSNTSSGAGPGPGAPPSASAGDDEVAAAVTLLRAIRSLGIEKQMSVVLSATAAPQVYPSNVSPDAESTSSGETAAYPYISTVTAAASGSGGDVAGGQRGSLVSTGNVQSMQDSGIHHNHPNRPRLSLPQTQEQASRAPQQLSPTVSAPVLMMAGGAEGFTEGQTSPGSGGHAAGMHQMVHAIRSFAGMTSHAHALAPAFDHSQQQAQISPLVSPVSAGSGSGDAEVSSAPSLPVPPPSFGRGVRRMSMTTGAVGIAGSAGVLQMIQRQPSQSSSITSPGSSSAAAGGGAGPGANAYDGGVVVVPPGPLSPLATLMGMGVSGSIMTHGQPLGVAVSSRLRQLVGVSAVWLRTIRRRCCVKLWLRCPRATSGRARLPVELTAGHRRNKPARVVRPRARLGAAEHRDLPPQATPRVSRRLDPVWATPPARVLLARHPAAKVVEAADRSFSAGAVRLRGPPRRQSLRRPRRRPRPDKGCLSMVMLYSEY